MVMQYNKAPLVLFIIFLLFAELCYARRFETEHPITLFSGHYRDINIAFYSENMTSIEKAGFTDKMSDKDARQKVLNDTDDKTADLLIARGVAYQYGLFGITPSETDAITCYTEAVHEFKSSVAYYNLAMLSLTKDNQKLESTKSYFEHANTLAESTDSLAQFCLITLDFDKNGKATYQEHQKQDWSKAKKQKLLKQLQPLVADKYAPAQYLYATLLLSDMPSAEKNKAAIQSAINDAANKGFPPSLHRRAQLQIEGLIFPQNTPLALQDNQLARDASYPAALLQMGIWLIQGVIVTKNEKEGIALIQQAAKQGYTEAKLELAKYCYTGIDGTLEKDQEQAKLLVDFAEEKRDANADYVIGKIYLYGREGVRDKDQAKGRSLIMSAAKKGNSVALNHSAALRINESPTFMTLFTLETIRQQFKQSADQNYATAWRNYGQTYYDYPNWLLGKKLNKVYECLRQAELLDFNPTEEDEATFNKTYNKSKKAVFKKSRFLEEKLYLAFGQYDKADLSETKGNFQGKSVSFPSLNENSLMQTGWNGTDDIEIKGLTKTKENALTLNAYGFAYEYGLLGCALCPNNAIQNYQDAKNLGSSLAACNLGMFYIKELEELEERKEGFKEQLKQQALKDIEALFKEAITKDDPALGKYCLAKFRSYTQAHHKRESDIDTNNAQETSPEQLLEEAAIAGCSFAQYSQGCSLIKENPKGKQRHRGIRLISDAAEDTCAPAPALYAKALLIKTRELVVGKQREIIANQLIDNAAAQFYAPALNERGEIHLSTMRKSVFPGKKNHAAMKAKDDFEQSALQNHSIAKYHLAEAYLYGHGVEQDRQQAKAFFEEAAEQKFQPAKEALETHFPQEVDEKEHGFGSTTYY